MLVEILASIKTKTVKRGVIEGELSFTDFEFGQTAVTMVGTLKAEERVTERKSEVDVRTAKSFKSVKSTRSSVEGRNSGRIKKGDVKAAEPTLVRVHIPNTLRDICEVYNADRTSWSFNSALRRISEEGKGVAVLLSGEDYGQDLSQNLEFVLAEGNQSERGHRTGADLTIGTGSQILRDLGVGKMRLLSYPAKFNAIQGFDLEVVDFVPFAQ